MAGWDCGSLWRRTHLRGAVDAPQQRAVCAAAARGAAPPPAAPKPQHRAQAVQQLGGVRRVAARQLQLAQLRHRLLVVQHQQGVRGAHQHAVLRLHLVAPLLRSTACHENSGQA